MFVRAFSRRLPPPPQQGTVAVPSRYPRHRPIRSEFAQGRGFLVCRSTSFRSRLPAEKLIVVSAGVSCGVLCSGRAVIAWRQKTMRALMTGEGIRTCGWRSWTPLLGGRYGDTPPSRCRTAFGPPRAASSSASSSTRHLAPMPFQARRTNTHDSILPPRCGGLSRVEASALTLEVARRPRLYVENISRSNVILDSDTECTNLCRLVAYDFVLANLLDRPVLPRSTRHTLLPWPISSPRG